jgi:hypothetical protein
MLGGAVAHLDRVTDDDVVRQRCDETFSYDSFGFVTWSAVRFVWK